MRGRDTLKEALASLVTQGMSDEAILAGVSSILRGPAKAKLAALRNRAAR